MSWPPSILRLRIQGRSRGFGLWLPLFIIWPPIVLLAFALSPLVIVLAALLWPTGWGRPMLLSGPSFFRLFCSLRGFRIDVEGPSERVFISIR
jgi:hypothetical protein|tara:strand:- start:190 stop:468 length:279 start_codon:yes stop_codon:yes gene_type:complete